MVAILLALSAGDAGGPFDGYSLIHRLGQTIDAQQKVRLSSVDFKVDGSEFDRNNDQNLFEKLVVLPTKPVKDILHFMFRGGYWIRIDLFHPDQKAKDVVLANDYPMEEVILIESKQPPRYFGINQYRSQESAQPFFELEVPSGLSTYFLRISSLHHPSLLSLQLWDREAFRAHIDGRLISDIALTIPALIWIYHLFFFLLMRSRTYIFLIIGTGSLLLFFMMLKGHYFLTANEYYYQCGFIMPSLLCLGISGFIQFYFVIYRVSFHHERLFAWFYKGLGCLNIVFAIYTTFNLNHIQLWMIFPCVILASVSYWSIIQYKKNGQNLQKNDPGKLYAVISFPFLFSGIALILQLSGYLSIIPYHVDLQLLLLTIFLVGISLVMGVKSQKDRIEAQGIKQSILLGNAVQELITPVRLEENSQNVFFKSRYMPFENQMSGDWIQRWRNPDGSQHFLIGDVTGKGPQAALAVGVIGIAAHQAMRLEKDAHYALQEINLSLFEIFGGAVTSAALGVSIDRNFQVEVFHLAAPAWGLIHGGKPRFVSEPGPILGFGARLALDPYRFELMPGDLIFCYTDGFQGRNGTNRALMLEIKKILTRSSTHSHIIDEIVSWASQTVVEDDRAIFTLERGFEASGIKVA